MRLWKLGIVMACAGCGGGPKSGDGDSGVDTVDGDTDGNAQDTDGDTDTDPADTDDTDEVVVTGCYDVPIVVHGGYGAIGFEPLADGDTVQITHGSQGGWHIETAVKMEHIAEQVSILPTVTVVSTGQMISGYQGAQDANVSYVAPVMDGECSGETWGARAFLNDFLPTAAPYDNGPVTQADICALDGQEATITWTVTDLLTEGPRPPGTTSVNVVLAMDPYDDCTP